MKAIITDRETLASISPTDAVMYLRNRGWQWVESLGARGGYWKYAVPSGGETELLLPMDRTLADFTHRMAEVLQALEVVEGRSQLEIVQDIGSVNSDIVRVAVSGAAVADGTIPLEQALSLMNYSRQLLLAVAISSDNSTGGQDTARLRTRHKSARVSRFMSAVRLGRTEQGSYVIPFYLPVSPELLDSQGILDEGESAGTVPFEREVTETLARVLEGLALTLAQVRERGDIAPIADVARTGISVAFCHALMKLGELSRPGEIGISISWASNRKSLIGELPRFTLSSDTLPTLREVTTVLETIAYNQELSNPTANKRGILPNPLALPESRK